MKNISKIKVLVAALAGAFAWSAAADVQIGPGGGVVTNTEPFMVNEPTVYTGATNIYTYSSGYGAIDANLTLKNTTYLRLAGAASATPERGLYLATNVNADLTIDISGNSAFYASYRDSTSPKAWDDLYIEPHTYGADGKRSTPLRPTNLKVRLGVPNGEKDTTGKAKFVVNCTGSQFGSNASGVGLWLHYFSVESSAKANADGYIDVLQLNSGGVADFGQFANNNINYPVRILFNGGILRNSYMNTVDNKQLVAAANSTIVLEGINGKDIIIRKEYGGGTLNSGKGTIRFQGNCNVNFRDQGTNLPGTSGANRYANDIVSAASGGPIEWKNNGALLINNNGFVRTAGDDVLPYRADEPYVKLDGNGILDLDGHSVKVRTLIGTANAMVTNVSHGTYTSSKLVFGAEDTDGIFSATTYYGVSAEKVGAGTLVVSNVTMDVHNSGKGLFTVKAGTVILVGTNKIGDTDMFESDRFIIEEGATVIREVVIDVASGETMEPTVAYADGENGVKVRLIKKGAGTLVLSNGANTFSGGLVIDEGTVSVTAAGAQGTGKITVNNPTSKHSQIKFATIPPDAKTSIVYDNDIEVFGASIPSSMVNYTEDGAAICFAQTNQVLNGSITADSDLCIVDGYEGASKEGSRDTKIGDMQNYTGETMNGVITVNGDFYFTPGCKAYISGKITASVYRMERAGGRRGILYLSNANNEIGKVSLWSDNTPKLYVTAAGAVGGAAIEWQNTNTYQAQQRGTLDASYTGIVSVQSLNGPNYLRKTNDVANVGYSMGNNSPSTYTLKITGREDVDATKFCGGLCNANMSLELASRAGFTQVFSNVYSKSTKELKVTSGTLVIAGASYFPGLTTITVEADGVLDIRELGWVADAQVDQYQSLGAFPGLTTINIASTAKIKLAEGVELKAATVKVDGFQLNADTYSTGYPAAPLPWIEGAGTIKATSSPTLPVEAKDAVWTGAGADTSTRTAANWKDGKMPEFYFWGYCPCFGEGGSRADFPSGTQLLNGLSVYREGGFTIGGAADTVLALALGKLPTIAGGSKGENPESAEETFTFEVPVAVSNDAVADAEFWIPTHKTVKFSGDLRSTNLNIKQRGTGTVEFVDSSFSGDYYHQEGGYMRITGEFGAENDTRVFFVNDAANDHTYLDDSGKTAYYCVKVGDLTLDNAVIRKETRIGSVGQVNKRAADTYNWLHTTEGSTNVFTKIVKQTASMRIELDSNTTIVFEQGYGDSTTSSGGGFNPGMKSGCTNSTMVFNGPIKLIMPSKGTLSTASADNKGLTLVLGASSNVVVSSFTLNNYKVVCKADDAFVGVKRAIVTGSTTTFPTTLDLTTTYQRFEDIHVNNGNGIITGEYPATIDFTSVTNETFAIDGNHNFCPQKLDGWVKLAMSGTGYQIVGQNGKAVNYGSYGDIEVSNGTLELMPQTTWLNGTNFIVKGEGKLKLSATDKPQVGPQAVFHFASNGKVEIPAGVTVSVAAAFVDDGSGETPVSAGTYSAATDEGPMAGRITGEGCLRVRRGMMLILR